MRTFVWTGRTPEGTVRNGELEAESRERALIQLRRQRITVVSLKPKPREIKLPGLGEKVKEKDIVVFTRQFATMIDAGLPLVQCLDILAHQTENKTFAQIITQIKKDVEGGDTYASALRKHPKIFSDLYVNMVEAGEMGGILDTILNRLAGYIEKVLALKGEVKSALVYPTAIVIVAVSVIIFLMIFVIPVFAQMFTDFGGTLPAPTRLIMALSDLTRRYIFHGIAVFIGLIFAFKRFYRTEKGRKAVDAFLLKTPIFGPLIQKVAVAKFTRTLGTLISSGVPIIDGLEITARTAGNKIVEEAVLSTISSIKEGQTIAAPLSQKRVFPPMVVQMIEIGETTGALDAMLEKIADFYDEEVDQAVSALTSLLEPALMIFLGVTVGFMIVAMYLPIFKLAGVVTGGS
ncbi:MAG: type II secretion system F family protein [Nitrospinota bacterium]|nr:MAG: type II secretion system F family protein [Nitrospinota bacterium]